LTTRTDQILAVTRLTLRYMVSVTLHGYSCLGVGLRSLSVLVTLRSCLWVCLFVYVFVCVCLWVCYHDNSKLCASILTKLGL